MDVEVVGLSGAAEIMKLSVEAVDIMARNGAVPAFRVGSEWRFETHKLLDWMKNKETNGTPGYILVVDDEQMMCDVVCRRIKNAGYATRSAISVQEGIEIAIEETPSLILTDLMMPERDGVSLLKECSERFPGVPTIVMTGYPDDIMVREAMRYGPGAIITKPISRGQLIGNIETILHSPPENAKK